VGIHIVTVAEKNQIIHYFERLDIENIEKPQDFYIGYLDRFERVLNEEEAFHRIIYYCKRRYKKSEIEKRYRKQEEKYEHVVEQFFVKNNRTVYVYNTEVTNADDNLKKGIKYALNKRKDARLFRKMQGEFSCSHQLFKVTDFRTLRFFLKLSLREQCFSNFFFLKDKVAIIGNYDMSFPVWSVEEEIFKEYREIAEEAQLFIRG
jgi:hypothetical protein